MVSDVWGVGRMGCRTYVMSDVWGVGRMECRTYGVSDVCGVGRTVFYVRPTPQLLVNYCIINKHFEFDCSNKKTLYIS